MRNGPHSTLPARKWILTNNCGTQVRLYSRIPTVATVKPFFFQCAAGKAQILMANRKNWKAEARQALVRWVCGCNRAQCLANFGSEDTIDGWWDVLLPILAIYRFIAPDRRILDYGLHGVRLVPCTCRVHVIHGLLSNATRLAYGVVPNWHFTIGDGFIDHKIPNTRWWFVNTTLVCY